MENCLYTKLMEINKLMRDNGIQTDPKTGKNYFTGYSYKQLYDWDQYFETMAQLYLGWDTGYAKNGIEIFLDYQDDDGFSPRGVGHSNGCVEQKSEMVKPFLAQIALLIYRHDGNLAFLDGAYYEKLKKYLLFWLRRVDENDGLAYWDSSVHSGMDNQHERAGYWKDCYCLAVDLNCYLVRECEAFSLVSRLLGKNDDAEMFHGYSEKIRRAVSERLWDDEKGFFFDLDRRSGERIQVLYLGAFAAMWADVATAEQAERMVNEHLLNENEFRRGFLYPALAASEPGYSETLLETDIPYLCNWRANTWIPLNYILYHSLRKYGFNDAASELARVTYETVSRVGNHEYFTTDTVQGQGMYPFWGWTLLAYFMPV